MIGEPDTNSYPLMTAINQATSRMKLYGWIDPTLNFSTSAHSNAPEANDVYSNRFEMNQLVLYAERLPDSVQRNHIDWGYHLTALYGTDYRYTTAKGYWSGPWVNDHREYGFDPTLEYVDVYVPQVAQGMNVRVGRFISVPGIEAQLAPNNYIFSHSLLYAIDPFTDTGLIATVKLNDQWLVQLGITAGHDVALWTPDAKPSGTACLSYTTKSVNDNL
ncbi:MAG: outer membrane beta-barrel protein, partial [Candidatus Sulfotelmatobacter sp.]